MELNVISGVSGKASGKISVADSHFGQEYNEALIHQVVVASLAAQRAGSHQQKTRAMVRGGGAKPWKQKGTGRARAGTSRSPLWRGGGIVFARVPRDYSQKVNKKMYRAAMRAILSELIREERLVVVDQFVVDTPKTKALTQKLAQMGLSQVLIITSSIEMNLALASRNLIDVAVCEVGFLNPAQLIAFEKVVVTADVMKQIEEKLT